MNVFDALTQAERSELIKQLYQQSEPGTLTDLDYCSLAELRELAQNLEAAE